MTTILAGSNIDDVRLRIMDLEDAAVFDAMAWSRVLADLEAAGRVSALADAKRRMETARSNQPNLALALRKSGKTDATLVAFAARLVSAETARMEFAHQDWLHSSEGLPDYDENERRTHLDQGDKFCPVCEDWIKQSELRRWSGDDMIHLLCPGCGRDMIEPYSVEVQ